MAVAQARMTRSKRGMRRSHDRLTTPTLPTLSIDSKSGEHHLRHHMTPMGFYRGRRILNLSDDIPTEE